MSRFTLLLADAVSADLTSVFYLGRFPVGFGFRGEFLVIEKMPRNFGLFWLELFVVVTVFGGGLRFFVGGHRFWWRLPFFGGGHRFWWR